MPSTRGSALRALIVGGSLAGLTSALALTRAGITVTVLERSDGRRRSGAALAADPQQLDVVLGTGAASIVLSALFAPGVPVSLVQPVAWSDLRAGLGAAVQADPRAELLHDQRVVEVGQDAGSVWARTDDGDKHVADVLIGADGHRSLVRRTVAPDRPNATFAGYSLWVGVTDEADLPDVGEWPRGLDIRSSGMNYLLGYPLPAQDGTLTPGRRRMGWAWYDSSRNDLLHEKGAVADGVVHHSIRSQDIPETVYTALQAQAQRLWPAPWRQAIDRSIARRAVTATPIAEYVPNRLAAGRVALVGNAAHVPTPMTGSGFAASLDDADTLARVLDRASADGVQAALQDYQQQRLPAARHLVRSGQGFSKAFAAR